MTQDLSITRSIEQLYEQVQAVIETSRATVYRAANTAMVHAYWNIGRLIVEEEQKGEQRAEYGLYFDQFKVHTAVLPIVRKRSRSA